MILCVKAYVCCIRNVSVASSSVTHKVELARQIPTLWTTGLLSQPRNVELLFSFPLLMLRLSEYLNLCHSHRSYNCIYWNSPAGICFSGKRLILSMCHRFFFVLREAFGQASSLAWIKFWKSHLPKGKFRNVPSTSLTNVFHHGCLFSVWSEILHEARTVSLKSQTVICTFLVSLCPSAGTGILSSQPEENPHWWNANMV